MDVDSGRPHPRPYEILAPLGAGGMGEVYRARDTRLGWEAAVKVPPLSIEADEETLARFEREAKAVTNGLQWSQVGHRIPGQCSRRALLLACCHSPLAEREGRRS